MKHIITYTSQTILLFCLFAGLFSCNEDKGNYDYAEINALEEIAINDTTVVLGDTLRIAAPKLTFDTLLSGQPSEADFTFTWHVRSGDNYPQVCEGRDLEIEIKDPNFKMASSTQLIYRVVNKKTEVAYYKPFNVSVVNPMGIGYVALCDKGDGLELDIVAYVNQKFTLYTDVLEKTGSTLPRTGVEPWDIVAHIDNEGAMNPMAIEGRYSMYILTDQYTTHLLPKDYSWKESYDISNRIEKNSYLDTAFVRKGQKVIAKKLQYNYNTAHPNVAMYHEEPGGAGNWYIYTSYMMMNPFSVRMNYLRPEGTVRYEPAPHIGMLQHGVMYYDKEAKKFMYGTLAQNNYLTKDWYYTQNLPSGDQETADLFRYDTPTDGLLHMGPVPGDAGQTESYALLKQLDGDYKYIEFGGISSTATATTLVTDANTKIRTVTISAGSNIGNAKFFARMPKSTNQAYLYYATNDNQVYRVSLSTGAVTDITSSILKDDGYSEITCFKFTVPESYTNETGPERRALAVGTYNASLGEKTGGKLEFFLPPTATNDGSLELAKYPVTVEEGEPQITMSWTGLGKIVGLTYKRQ